MRSTHSYRGQGTKCLFCARAFSVRLKGLPSALASQRTSTVFNIRLRLRLACYYRCIIKDFSSIEKPLTDILKGENGKISASHSKNMAVSFDKYQVQVFNTLIEVLVPEEVILPYPEFKMLLDLTTNASSLSLRVVDGHRIVIGW